MPWPPPDLIAVLDTLDSKYLREQIGRLTVETPRTRGEAFRIAVQSPDTVRRLYEENRLTSGRPGVTWFRHHGSRPDPRQVGLPRLRELGAELEDEEPAMVWALQHDDGLSVRIAYVAGKQNVPPSFEIRQRLGFATLHWRRLQKQEVLEVHCRSTDVHKILRAVQGVISTDTLEVLDFTLNTAAEQIRTDLGARLAAGFAKFEDPDSQKDTVQMYAKPRGDLASQGEDFGPGGQYTDLRGRGRLCETDTGLKFRLSQRDHSVVFYHSVTLAQTASVFGPAAKAGVWPSYREAHVD